VTEARGGRVALGMKRLVRLPSTLLLALVLLAALAGCMLLPSVTGSGTLIRTVHPSTGFNGIQASHAFQVRVVPDSICSVSVTCDDNLLPYLLVQNSGTSLRLGLVDGYNYLGVTLLAEVHMPAVAVIDASGASTVRADSGIASPGRLTVMLSGASVCEAPGISCGDATFAVSGASRASFTGTAGVLTLVVSGASQANLLDCAATAARVTVSGASEVWVDVGAQPLDLDASGASTLYYGGTPALAVHSLSGGSRLVKVR
jgi:hypothetical protein